MAHAFVLSLGSRLEGYSLLVGCSCLVCYKAKTNWPGKFPGHFFWFLSKLICTSVGMEIIFLLLAYANEKEPDYDSTTILACGSQCSIDLTKRRVSIRAPPVV